MSKNDFLRRTELFLSTVEAGSISKAAQKEGMSAPQMSRELAQLERELGETLLVRSRSGARTTAKGAYFADAMAPLLVKLENIERTVRQSSRLEAVLAVPLSLSSTILPQWIAGFRQTFPDASLSLIIEEAGKSERVEIGAGRGAFDFKLEIARVPQEENLIAVKTASVPLVNIASPEYLSENGDVWAPDALTVHRLGIGEDALPGLGSLIEQVVLYRKDQRGEFFTLSTAHARHAQNVLALCAAVRAGDCIGIAVPRFLVESELRSGSLVEVLPLWRIESTSLWFMRPLTRYPSLLGQRLLNWLQESSRRTPGFE